MIYTFSKSVMGYSHKKNNKPCQDYSSNYQSPDYTIITCCDGHGGDQYIRSEQGSKLASKAIHETFMKLDKRRMRYLKDAKYLERIKLEVLCEWNRLVEQDIKAHPFKSKEFKKLDELTIQMLKHNPIKAYGTTLTGACLIKDKVIVIGIGDSDAIKVRKGEISQVFDESDEPVANITSSMCQEDAYNHMHIAAIDIKDIDALLLCSDGLTSPYQSYSNFKDNFVIPLMRNVLIKHDFNFVDNFVISIANRLGIGDDVSLAYIINSNTFRKYYR